MEFDIATFDAILYGVMNTAAMASSLYSARTTHDVFRYYFEKYEKYMHNPHPRIRREQIARIARDMPYLWMDGDHGYGWIDPDEYPPIIDLHFVTNYRDCDYNINHFFSGKIREMRFYEMQAGYRVKAGR